MGGTSREIYDVRIEEGVVGKKTLIIENTKNQARLILPNGYTRGTHNGFIRLRILAKNTGATPTSDYTISTCWDVAPYTNIYSNLNTLYAASVSISTGCTVVLATVSSAARAINIPSQPFVQLLNFKSDPLLQVDVSIAMTKQGLSETGKVYLAYNPLAPYVEAGSSHLYVCSNAGTFAANCEYVVNPLGLGETLP